MVFSVMRPNVVGGYELPEKAAASIFNSEGAICSSEALTPIPQATYVITQKTIILPSRCMI
jgi:hypothetical protein